MVLQEIESVFSEKTTPVSQLIEGNPDRPLREPALVLLACLFNVFQIYQLFLILTQLGGTVDPLDPFSYFNILLLQLIPGLIGWYVAFCIILLIGATLVYFINRRVGSALILVISIIGLLIGFVGALFTFIFTNSFIALITGLMAPIVGMLAGIYGIRSKDSRAPAEVQEII